MTPLIEVCIDSVAGAITAEEAGAARVELCAGLVEGGTTPSIGMVRSVLEEVHRVGVQVLIRPRGGDFCYNPAEIDVMLADIAAIRGLPAPDGVMVGFVVGALTAAGDVDVPTTRELLAACQGAPVTFHKAFDFTRDLGASLETVSELGVSRVLTSGGRARAADALPVLAGLVERAGDRIGVLIGGGVRPHNAAAIVAATAAREIHLKAADVAPSPMRFWPDDLAIGSIDWSHDRTRTHTSRAVLENLRQALAGTVAP